MYYMYMLIGFDNNKVENVHTKQISYDLFMCRCGTVLPKVYLIRLVKWKRHHWPMRVLEDSRVSLNCSLTKEQTSTTFVL